MKTTLKLIIGLISLSGIQLTYADMNPYTIGTPLVQPTQTQTTTSTSTPVIQFMQPSQNTAATSPSLSSLGSLQTPPSPATQLANAQLSAAGAPAGGGSNAILQQIANNTQAIQTWLASPGGAGNASDPQQSGYTLLGNFSAQDTNLGTLLSQAQTNNPTAFPNLAPASLSTILSSKTPLALPYLASLNPDNPTDPWVLATNQAILNLAATQTEMGALHTLVNQSLNAQGSSNTLLQMNTPQLLRMLLIEQATNNAIAYQMLQRQNDQTLMQASNLALLAEQNKLLSDMNNTLETTQANTIRLISAVLQVKEALQGQAAGSK